MMNANNEKAIITAAAVDLYPNTAAAVTAALDSITAAADVRTVDIMTAAAAVATITAAADDFAACLSDYAGLSHVTDVFLIASCNDKTAAAAAAAVARIAAAAAVVSDFINAHFEYCEEEEVAAAADSARIAAAYMDGYGIFTDEWSAAAKTAAAAAAWIAENLEG